MLKAENEDKSEASVQDILGHSLHTLRVPCGSRQSFNF